MTNEQKKEIADLIRFFQSQSAGITVNTINQVSQILQSLIDGDDKKTETKNK